MTKPLRLAITTGDLDGIGLEICIKSLISLGPKPKVIFFLFRSNKSSLKDDLKKLDRTFNRVQVSSFEEYLEKYSSSNYNLVDIASSESPAKWVVTAATLCLKKQLSGLSTAPISKTVIKSSGYREIGHTELFQTVAKTASPFMAFLGKTFNVLLVTGHIPLTKVKITKARLYQAGLAALNLKKILSAKQKKLPVALVGINPHAGEENIIGSEETKIFLPVIRRLSKKTKVVGPLVPDAAFMPKNWHKYSVYVCPYHDQGLIPFKAINGTAGVHLTLGIPFVRTSVDHGTAKDIYGKDKADASSMKNAIELAIKLIRQKG